MSVLVSAGLFEAEAQEYRIDWCSVRDGLVDRSVVIKGREYKSPYDWCQLNNHQGAIGVFMRAVYACKMRNINIPKCWLIVGRNNRCQ